MRAIVIVGVAVATVCALPLGAVGPEGEILYTRTDVLRATAGETELRRASTRRIELPQESCDEKEFSCVADRVYGQVYSLSFFEVHSAHPLDGVVTRERMERGRMLIALDLPVDDRDRLDQALLEHLAGLSAPSYARPRAGMAARKAPFEQSRLARSSLPAWICREDAGAYAATIFTSREQQLSARASLEENVVRGCAAIEHALDDVDDERVRTMPAVGSQLRHTVRLRSVSTLAGLTWADQLAVIPHGAIFEKRTLSRGERTGSVRDHTGDVFVGREGRHHDVERRFETTEVVLDLVGAPMWATRWSLDTVTEQFGRDPDRDPGPVRSIAVAVVPVTDLLMPDPIQSELGVPERAVIDRIVGDLASRRTMDPDVITRAFADPELWPARGDWMIVTCREDGSAHYGIAPFAQAAEVANAEDACAAIYRELGI